MGTAVSDEVRLTERMPQAKIYPIGYSSLGGCSGVAAETPYLGDRTNAGELPPVSAPLRGAGARLDIWHPPA